ncbi:MAG: phosphoribosylanthranilate isomerase [Nanoarchaeota archaeon]
MTKIKICGITNYEDAKNAVDLGADFLGFNFYTKSPRYINYKDAKYIIQKLNGKSEIVGVFVNDSIKRVSEICNYYDLDLIQLSGDEDIKYTTELKKATNKKIIKAFRVKNGINVNLINSFNSDYIMLDSFKDGFYGGTGESFDLDVVKGIDNKKLFLAGGLNNKNVKLSIKKLHPYAIYVCSSI